MACLTYLERRVGTYYARIDIPADLVAHYGTTTRKKSLRTKDENEAKRRLCPVIQAWQAEFDDIRSRREITDCDKAGAVWQHYSDALDRDDQRRTRLPGSLKIQEAAREAAARAQLNRIDTTDPLKVLEATLEVHALRRANDLDADLRRAKLADLRKHLTSGETALIAHEVDLYAHAHQLIIEPGSELWRDLARRMMRAEIEALERAFERDRGDYGGTPKDPIVKPASGTARERAAPGETIMELFETYARENPKGITADTLAQARRDIGTFIDLVGNTCPVRRIDKKAVREWKALLIRYPVKATETKAFAGMKLAQIVRENEKVGKPVLSARTVNRYLAGLSAFCGWLVDHGYLDANPVAGMALVKSKKRTVFPFTSDQLNVLFRSPLFTGAQSAAEWRLIAKPGNVMIRDHRFWVPLVMLFSGARPAEIAQLATADVRQVHGVWILHITTEGDSEKSTKNEGSMRVVPIHSELIKLGFLGHHAQMKAAGEAQLFPDAARNSRGQMIADTSREFGRYLTRLGLKKGRGLSLYSFRHGVADALRRAGHLDEQFGFILGHTNGTMTGRYGYLPQGMLDLRVRLIESISYPELNLDHLGRTFTGS